LYSIAGHIGHRTKLPTTDFPICIRFSYTASEGTDTLTLNTWFSASLIVLLAASLQAVTGFGFALVSVPLLLMVLPPKIVVPANICVSMTCLLLLSLRTRKHAHVPTVKWLAAGSLFGIPFGAYVLTHANPQGIKTLASVVTLLIAIYSLARWKGATVAGYPKKAFCLIVGCVSGFLATSVSMPGPPVVLAMSNSGMPKHEFRATGSTYFAIAYSISLFTMLVNGLITREVVILVASLAPVAVIGNLAGDKLFERVPQPVFDKFVPVLLMLTALNNIVR
jgi:uncharacterized protein